MCIARYSPCHYLWCQLLPLKGVKLQLIEIELDEITVLGEEIDMGKPDSYKYPPMDIEDLSPYESIRIVNGNPCTNCIASLASYLHGYIDTGVIESATQRVDM